MAKFRIEIKEIAQKHIKQHYKSGDKKSIKTIEKIFLELSENPYEGTGNPKPLKHQLSEFWFRKINQKDRLIYFIEDELITVYVVSAMGHYFDK